MATDYTRKILEKDTLNKEGFFDFKTLLHSEKAFLRSLQNDELTDPEQLHSKFYHIDYMHTVMIMDKNKCH